MAAGLLLRVPAGLAQSIEPRAYSNAPVGVNFLIAGTAFTRGGLSFDSALPLTKARIETSGPFLAYARMLDLWGMSGKLDAVLPYAFLSGSASSAGNPVSRDVDGWMNPSIRMTLNFFGAPALDLKGFRTWKQDLILGASLQVSLPWGQYDHNRLINLGTNRWSVKPELGLSKTWGSWTLELQAAMALYGDNADFFGGQRRSQEPLYSAQGHAIYGLKSGIWVSLDATCFGGGRTAVNGVPNDNYQENWRLGATLALPVDAHNSIKLYASSGVSARTGNNYELYGLAWQYRWGGGL